MNDRWLAKEENEVLDFSQLRDLYFRDCYSQRRAWMTVFQMGLIWYGEWDLPADHTGHRGDGPCQHRIVSQLGYGKARGKAVVKQNRKNIKNINIGG